MTQEATLRDTLRRLTLRGDPVINTFEEKTKRCTACREIGHNTRTCVLNPKDELEERMQGYLVGGVGPEDSDEEVAGEGADSDEESAGEGSEEELSDEESDLEVDVPNNNCEEGLAYANDESEAEDDELEAEDFEQML